MNNGGSGTNNSGGAAGGTCDGDDPQNTGTDVNPLEKVIFTYTIKENQLLVGDLMEVSELRMCST